MRRARYMQAKAKLFAALFAACLLSVLPGCRNPVRPSGIENESTETGTLSLTIRRPGLARTILPGAPADDDFVAFMLNFASRVDSALDFDYGDWDGGGAIRVAAGTWDLTLTAFLEGGENPVPVATGVYEGLVLVGGGVGSVEILLRPLPGGDGRFEWDITVADDVVSAKLEIFVYDDPLPVEPTYTRSFYDVDGKIEGARPLPAGRYLVVLTLRDGGEETELTEILHIYRNMVSVFDPDLTSFEFPSALYRAMAAAWDGESFGDLAVTHGHFAILGIDGVDAYSFADIVGGFADHYPVARADYFPGTLKGLKALVDAALVAIGRNSIVVADHEYPNDAEGAIAGLVRNDTAITFDWTDDDGMVTARIGIYSVLIVFDPPGETLAERLLWLRTNARDGHFYVVRISGPQTIHPSTADIAPDPAALNATQILPTGRNLVIVLRGAGATPNVINLSANGNLFRIPSGVTVTLDNVTLMGRMVGGDGNANNNNHLVRINHGGTLVANERSRIMGNRNTSTVSDNLGGGVRVNAGGAFILNGGTVSGNSLAMTAGAMLVGAGVRVESGGRFYMLDGTISGNTTNAGTGNLNFGTGGGVWVGAGGAFRISDGIIHGVDYEDEELRNIANNDGASLFSQGAAESGKFADAFDGRAVGSLGGFVRLGDIGTGDLTVRVVDGERVVQERGESLALQLAWLRSFARDGGTYHVEISADEILSPTNDTGVNSNTGHPLPAGRSGVVITLRGIGAGRSVSLPSASGAAHQGTLFRVPSGVTLALDDVALIGRHTPGGGALVQNNNHLVQINAGGTLRMETGSRIMNNNNTAAAYGGGVRVNAGGALDMLGGVISGNAGEFGGGVFVEGGGVFRISDGTIYGGDETVMPESLRNVSRSGAGASLGNFGEAWFGSFGEGGVFDKAGDLGTNNGTITVAGGAFDIPPEPPATAPLAERLEWFRAFGQGNDDIIIEIGRDETLSPAQAVLPFGRTITLRGVDGDHGVYLSANGILFTVGFGTTLVLEDIALVGRMAGGNGGANNNNHLIRVNAGGALRMNAGSRVTGNTGAGSGDNLGGGVRVNAGGAFVLDGGEIYRNTSTGGSSAGGAHIAAGGSFTMLGGRIYGNTSTGGSSGGGVIVVGGVAGNGVFDMLGGEIAANTATGATSGGGVIVAGTPAIHAFFNMHGGTISGNTSTIGTASANASGGVRVGGTGAGSTFNMRGGTISGNDARSIAHTAGGGVSVVAGSFFRISDGVIHGIDADTELGNLALGGSVALFRATEDGGALYGTFDDDGDFARADSGGVLPNVDLTVEVIGGAFAIPLEPPVAASLALRLAWLRAFGSGGDVIAIEISENQDITPARAALPAGRTTILRGVGGERVISLSTNGVLFTVDSGATLVLENITLVGRSQGGNGDANNNNHLVRVTGGGTLRMNAGARITGNTGTGTGANLGGGAHVVGTAANPATLILDGGEISGNTATGASTAGGVHVGPGGMVHMLRGEISGNTATGATSAGGVIVAGAAANSSVFNMHGGTAISGNIASSTANTANAAGGVRVSAGGSTFNMRGGTISGNEARSAAATASGGVNVGGGGFFRISDGIIHGNDADAADANTVNAGWAALFRAPAAATEAFRGTFHNGEFIPQGDPLGNSDYTIEVENGEFVLRP